MAYSLKDIMDFCMRTLITLSCPPFLLLLPSSSQAIDFSRFDICLLESGLLCLVRLYPVPSMFLQMTSLILTAEWTHTVHVPCFRCPVFGGYLGWSITCLLGAVQETQMHRCSCSVRTHIPLGVCPGGSVILIFKDVGLFYIPPAVFKGSSIPPSPRLILANICLCCFCFSSWRSILTGVR